MENTSHFKGHRQQVTQAGAAPHNGSSGSSNNSDSVRASVASVATSLDPVALAVDLPSSLASKVRSADEMLSAEKINTRSAKTWNPFLNGGATDYAALVNPTLVNGKITGGRYEKPNELFDAKTVLPVKMILAGFAKIKPDIQPLVDAVMPVSLMRRPAHKFNVDGKVDTRVVFFGGTEPGDPQHRHIDEIVQELGKKHMRVIVQWSHPADYSLSQSTQGGTPSDILGNTYMPAGSSHINLFSTGMIGGKPVVVTSNWGDASRIDDEWPELVVHLLAIDYQAGVEDKVPDETLAAWKHNADMWDCFAAMMVPFAGDDPFGYTKYQWNPLEVYDQASATAVATELANLDWDTFKTKFGAFYCAEAQYSVANWGPQDTTLLKASRFASTRIGRIIKTFGEAPDYAGKDIAWKRAHPEIGWEWLTRQGKANGGIDPKEFVRLGFPKPNNIPEAFTQATYSNRVGIFLEFLPENIEGWQSYRPRNRDGLVASPLSAATTAWSLVRSYMPRQKIAEAISTEIMLAYRSGVPAVQAVVNGLTGGIDPEGATGQAVLGQIAAALAGHFLVAALTDDTDLDSEFKRDPATGQTTDDKSKWTYVSTAQKTMLEKAGYKELTSDADKAKVKKVWDDFMAVLTNPDNTSQEKLDAALLNADRNAKSLRVRREPLVPGAPAYDGLMCFVPPGCWAMWAQQPFYSEAYSIRYVASCVHKSIASDAALKFAEQPVTSTPELPKSPQPPVTPKPPVTPDPPVTPTRPVAPPTASDPGVTAGGRTLADEIRELLAKPHPLSGIDIDLEAFRAFTNVAVGQEGSGTQPTLLLHGYQWKAGEKVPRVPLQLCEFLAYKTSLAYDSEERIKHFLETGHEGITRFKFFTSSNGDAAGKLADAQGYGFVLEGKAFVIFRGTESGNDWSINRLDVMTDDISAMSAKARKKLEAKYGSLIASLGEPSPGRHTGFSIAWAAIKPQVEGWLADVLSSGDASSIIYAGHSLGGAMAQIAAFDHARKLEGNPALIAHRFAGVVTFGAPMVGGRAFSEHYKRLLGDRTVLVESSGDLVPRIMQRWYYRMLYPLRQWALAGVNAKAKQDATRFASVAPAAWMFSAEPPLSSNDIDKAITDILQAAERATKEAAEAKKKASQQGNSSGESASNVPESTTGPNAGSSTGNQVTGPSKTNGTGDSSTGKTEPAPTWAYWAVAGVFVIVGAGIAWYFVRRKLYSHDIEQRYALYLSTLSYQQLRSNFGGDLARANNALDQHLRFVRGDTAKVGRSSKEPYYKSVHDLPVRIEAKETPAFVEYLKSGKAFF